MMMANVSSMNVQKMKRQQHVHHDEEMERVRRITLIVFKKKYSHQIAGKMYEQRQWFFIYMPLQFLALIISLGGFLMGTDIGDENAQNTLENWSSFTIGVIGVITLMYNNIGKKIDYDSKATSHAVVADNMRWILHDLELIQHKFRKISGCDCSSIGDSRSSMDGEGEGDGDGDNKDDENSNTCGNCNKMKKFAQMIDDCENLYFMDSRTPPPMLPRQIEIAFEKLTVQFELLFPAGGKKYGSTSYNISSSSNGSTTDFDEATYSNMLKLAFSEMAIVLGDSDKQWLITLPEPNYAVQKTMKRISKILSSVQEDDHPVNHRFKKMISALAISSRHQVSNKRKDLRVDSTLSVINEGSTASAYY